MVDQMKICCRCGQQKPLTEFFRDNTKPDGYRPSCKVCFHLRTENHNLKPFGLKRCKACGEIKIFEQFTKGRISRCKACHRIDVRKRIVKLRETDLLEFNLLNNKYSERRRSRKRAAYVEDINSLMVLESHDGTCGICGEDVDPTNFHVDHIFPLSKGGLHAYVNVHPAHVSCNQEKGDRIM